MGKMLLVIITIVVAFSLMGSAYALLIDDESIQDIAKSSTMDVRIVERETAVTSLGGNNAITSVAMPSPMNINTDAPTTYIKETINNFVPGEEVKLQYKIVNNGTIDVLLSGVIVTTDNQELKQMILLKWTVTEYTNGAKGKAITNHITGQTLDEILSLTDVLSMGITLDNDAGTDDYCELELIIQLVDNDNTPFVTMQSTEFTVTPEYIQN